jgi:hypothetical protein
MTQRIIHRLAERPNRSIAEALEALAVAELIKPGRRFMVISPWISDFPIIDNRGGKFSALDRTWSASRINFSSYLRALLRRGVGVSVACGEGRTEIEFVERLHKGARQDGTQARLTVRVSQLDPARILEHEKALIAEGWAVHGSMNLTYRGVEVNGELVTISTDPSHVAELTTTMTELFQ